MLNVNQAAKQLKASPWTIRHLCASGKIKAIRRSGKWYILPDFMEHMHDDVLSIYKGLPNWEDK